MDTATAISITSPEEFDGLVNFETLYIVCEVFNCFLIVTTLYILTCMIAYGLKKKKWKNSGRKSDVNSGMIYTAAVVAVVMTIPRYIADQVMFNVVYINGAPPFCEVIMDIGNACYFSALYPIYFFLWLRQKALYGHPAMRRLAGKCVAVLSWVTLIGLSIAAVGVGLLFLIPDDYSYGDNGCILTNSIKNQSHPSEIVFNGSYYALVGLLLFAQLCVLSLFIYPMMRSNAIQNEHKTSRKSSKVNLSLNTDSTESTSFRRRSWIAIQIRQVGRKLSATSINGKSDTVKNTIRRSIYGALASMLSDIFAMAIVSFIVPQTVPRFLTNTVYDISTMISVFCVLGTFESYKTILTVFFHCHKAPPQEKSSWSAEGSPKYSEKSHSRSNQDSSV